MKGQQMKALILNSGLGHRMGVLTSEHPKCMTEVSQTDTILSRQLKLLSKTSIKEVVMTTGYFDDVLVNYCNSLGLGLQYTFVKNPIYENTNYIYSIYCAREQLKDDDIVLMHGDLVFEYSVLDDLLAFEHSCMKVSSTIPLPDKDFKAVVHNGTVEKVGVEFFTDAMEAQALYKLKRADWKVWLDKICEFCESDNRKCYAEVALNEVSDKCNICAYDVRDRLCTEIDTPEDLAVVKAKLAEVENRTVYLCFSADMVHSGHIAIIRKAEKLGKLIIGVLSDEAVASYKRFPLMPFEERRSVFENISGVSKVVEQKTLSYAEILRELRPTYVVHGDDWKEGFQKPVRDEVVSVLAEYGGKLVDMTSRFRTIDDIMEVTTKPIIFDGDTGGLAEHFVYTVRSLERMGVSMVIIEDKTGLKKNSLFGTEVKQTQDSVESFSAKIAAGKKAQKTKDFMICARIESLILERGMQDALDRAFAFVAAGADAIMIHSRKKDPAEIREFIGKFREKDKTTPIVLVPTSFNQVYESEWKELGANVIIYANQLTRTGFPAMQDAARTILQNHRAKECDDKCMSIEKIINLIPEE